MRSIIIMLFVFLGLLAGRTAHASDQDPWKIWSKPGVHALMRHAIAPGTGDPAAFKLDDCNTQRNINDVGKTQARTTGALIRDQGIKIDKVLSSQWCRCLETAELLNLGPVIEEPSLNSFFRNPNTESRQSQQVLERLQNLPKDSKAILITHQVNITALTGIFPRSGEIILIKVTDDADIAILSRLMPDT
ncbi:histidine phosphatase family protein [Thalassospira lucentensis]|uniref:histidine phosphatase family protein n=1 Tax=Thalassospira lucentensis TaxID=168935 RepID=UPI00142D45F9|nr:histidine phosphatase family protein [Thalassospira lucentensis]NIZ02232.1 histidine phosphatase family protein [Thalassospira lucentensis]